MAEVMALLLEMAELIAKTFDVTRVEDEVRMLQKNLTMLNAFLQNSEAEQNDSYVVQELVDQIKDVGLEAEDVVDVFNAMHRRRNCVPNILNRFSHVNMLGKVADKIRGLQKSITRIYDNKDTYGITQVHPCPAVLDMEQGWENAEEDDYVVGFDQHTTTLVKYLTSGDSERHVVSIFGMGGLGKTTLAKKVYNDPRIKTHFDCRAWGHASRECRGRDLLLGMLKRLMPPMSDEMQNMMSEDELKTTLHAYLRQKRYLVVIDAVWKIDDWNKVRQALPNSFNGSRVVITTRFKDVALHSNNQTIPYALSFLDYNTSLQLFCRKVFGKAKCPPKVENLAIKLVESCKGLPISVLLLGGLLATKGNDYETWSKFYGNISFNYFQHMRYLDILALSYKHLPWKLKSCFLYLSIFPMDYDIPARQLIRLWSAEGFVQKTDERKVEDVAEKYLLELISRNLVQASSRRTDGCVKKCRIHDLMRDLSMFEGDREKFLVIHSDTLLSPISKARRLSIQGNISDYISTDPHDPSCARSLLMFGNGNKFDTKHWKWIHKNMKLIRVLCLENVYVDSIPKEIGKLIFLRYLRIWSVTLSRIPSMPASICNLKYLETIGINGHVKHLPIGLWKLKKLRQLDISGGISLPPAVAPVDGILYDLQVLSYLLVNKKTSYFKALYRVPNVRKLHLKYNELKPMNEFEVAELLESLEALKQLQKLKLLNIPQSEPRLNLFPRTLTKITFLRSYMSSTRFRILGKLPKLQFLKLKGKFLGIIFPLCCVAGEFPSLQVFQMIDLEIEKWEMEIGAMPNLKRLVLSECYKLRSMPEELWSLTALRHMEVSRMSESFMKMIKEFIMKDECKLLIDSNHI